MKTSLHHRGMTLPGGFHLFHFEGEDGGGDGKKKTTEELLQDLGNTMTELKTEMGTLREGQGTIVTRMDNSDKVLEELKKGKGGDGGGGDDGNDDGNDGGKGGDGGGGDDGNDGGGDDGNDGKGGEGDFDLEKHPAFKKLQSQMEEQNNTITAQAESLKTMEKERDDARAEASKGRLKDSISRAASEAGIKDETTRQEFVDAKIEQFKLDDSGNLRMLDGSGEMLRSKTHPTEYMQPKEFFNGLKTTSSHWWNEKGSHKNTGGDGGSGGEGGDGEGGDDGDTVEVVKDVKEWQAMKSSEDGRKKIKQGKAVFRPAQAA